MSYITSIQTAKASIGGVVSGLDTENIISELMEIEKRPLTALEDKQTTYEAKLSAWQQLNTRTLAVQTAALNLVDGTAFMAKSFTSSDETIISGSASASAAAGTYYVTVNSLAKTNQIYSQGYADLTTTSVGEGTFSIQVGSGEQTDITIDSSNNTLAGLRDAINNSDAGVTATIINDGTTGSPYRLLLTSNTSGTVGQITTTSTLSGGTSPAFTTLQAAQDASITLGEGAGAITVTKSSNTITDLIPGVTLNLKKTNVGQTVTLDIASDTTAVKESINNFVTQYNNLMTYINTQNKYYAETETGGTLLGDYSLQMLRTDLRTKITSSVSGISSGLTLLSQIGITCGSDNLLTVDETKLDEALATNLNQVKKLFAANAEVSDARVSYISSNDKTQTSPTGGYAIVVTTAPTKASITAGTALAETLAQDETLNINGTAISLTSGMTQTEVLAAINGRSSETGVEASSTGGYLTLTRVNYGTTGTIEVISDISNSLANTTGIGNVQVTELSPGGESGTGTGAEGIDIQGTINGEACTGTGQILVGNEGNATTEGLKISVTASAPGSYGTISLTKGISKTMYDFSTSVIGENGIIATATESYQARIERLDEDIERLEEKIAAKELYYNKQFAAMESALGLLQSQGDYLSQQIANLSDNWGSE